MSTSDVPVRHILHADLDAFYASVEQRDRPELQGKPVLVGGSPEGRGVVAACSYEARAFGVHSAMPMRTALNLCTFAVVLLPRFDRYREVSQQVMDIFHSITPLVEPLSLDEAYLDITDVVTRETTPAEVGRALKARVRQDVGLTISVGAATSKSVAKIASDASKPDGLVVVEPGTEAAFLASMPVRRLAGIGPKAEQRLAESGIRLLGDLARQSEEWLVTAFGKRGPELGAMSRGEDPRHVIPVQPAKSMSAEVTFAQDLADADSLSQRVIHLSRRVAQRLEEAEAKGRTITLKLRLADFTTFTRSVTLAIPISDASVIQEVAQRLLEGEMGAGRRFRLLGVGVSNFTASGQLELFDSQGPPAFPDMPHGVLSP